jgi:chromate reductase
MTKIAVFVGSLRDGSYNKQLADVVEKLAPDGVVFEHANLHVPLFSEDVEKSYPAEVQKLKDLVASADGVLFVTPEYNRGIPGVLKNAIDWVSRQWGTNSFEGKPAAVIGASTGQWGTTMAQTQLKSVLVYLDTKLIGQPEVYIQFAGDVFHGNGEVGDDMSAKLTSFIDTFIEHVENNK